MYNRKTLYYDRIDVFEGINVNKISYYWYFLNKGFEFKLNVSNGCHDLLMMSMNLSDIAILNIKNADYRCIISGISKSEAMNLMQYKYQIDRKK